MTLSPDVSAYAAAPAELAKYGITRGVVEFFVYRGFRYSNMSDAINQARLEETRRDDTASSRGVVASLKPTSKHSRTANPDGNLEAEDAADLSTKRWLDNRTAPSDDRK